jgi:DNA repair protein RecO (recombination protein O)
LSAEKSDAIVIRQADFSESSRVLTLFTRDFGKVSCLAKGAKRLKSSFDLALDLLSQCRVVFLHKSSASLDLLTEAQLEKRFQPVPGKLSFLYGGYYVAELLNALTEEDDPHPDLYEAAVRTLDALSRPDALFVAITSFELTVLKEIGQLPDFEICTICQLPIEIDDRARFWVSQGGLICSKCGHSEYETTAFQPGSLAILRQMVQSGHLRDRLQVTQRQQKEIRQILTSAISHALGRRPKILGMLNL